MIVLICIHAVLSCLVSDRTNVDCLMLQVAVNNSCGICISSTAWMFVLKFSMQKLVRVFGPDVILENGNVNRPKLRELIFSDPSKRKALNAITHPVIRMGLLKQVFLINTLGTIAFKLC